MKLSEKLFMERKELTENGPVTIVAFGDSVTHGAFSGGEIDHEAVYHSLLRKIANHGDYTEFVVDEPINGFVYLNNKEINMYLQETHLESDLIEWLHRWK